MSLRFLNGIYFYKPYPVSKHLLTKYITSKTHYDFIPKIEEKDCFQILWTRMSNTVMASLTVVLTCVKGHFVIIFSSFGAKTTEIMSPNYRVRETKGDVFKFLDLNQIVREQFTENINAFNSKIKC